uniref:60S ribosomal protein L34 n=1 Tax=Rhabditophanes sp. KR3021 TaxID=114890 RepID=A0AC35U2B4_9BILA
MAQRLVYRRRHGYNTKSNKIQKVKTPGGTISLHYQTKKASVPKCGDTKVALKGIKAYRPCRLSQLTKRFKSVSRAYGGNLSANAVKERILRAFLIEEQKIVAAVVNSKEKAVEAVVAGKK